MLKSGKTRLAIISLLVFSIITISAYAVFVAANTHTSTADLEPEWSTPGVTNPYTVTICNNDSSNDEIDEVRIYQNSLYTNFDADEKTGWYKSPFNPIKEYYQYTATSSSDYIDPNECTDFTFSATAPTQDPQKCLLEWKFETRDIDEIWKTIYDTTSIDNKAPETIKEYDLPFHTDGTYDWITTSTLVTLTATDLSLECGIGVDHIMWRNTLLDIPDDECVATCDFDGDQFGDEQWNNVSGDEVTFYKEEKSCHLIEFYAVDKLGNTEEINRQCVFVDDTPPVVRKNNGNDAIKDSSPGEFPETEGFFHWITPDMPITFSCIDQAPHPSDNEKLCYKVSYDYPEWDYITEDYCSTGLDDEGYCCVSATDESPFKFYFNEDEDSVHNLEYYCKDAVGNEGTEHLQYYKVDSTPPKITKTMIGEDHLGYRNGELNEDACPPKDENDECYVRDYGENGVEITAEDGGEICHVDNLECFAEVWWEYDNIENCGDVPKEDGWCRIYAAFFNELDRLPIIFEEDSDHKVIVNCEDALGNSVEDREIFLVDSTPPVTTKTYGDPHYECDPDFQTCGGRGIYDDHMYPYWITSETPITLSAEDEKVGVDKTYWRYEVVDDYWCTRPATGCIHYKGTIEMGFQAYVDEPFTLPEPSCHIIEYYSVDKLGNVELVENVESPYKRQCVFVDNTAPRGMKEIGEPMVGDIVGFSSSGTGSSSYNGVSAHLYAPLITDYPPANEGRIRIPLEGMTLDDLDTLSWEVTSGVGYAPHADVFLGNGETLTFEYAKVDPTQCDDSADYPVGDFNTFNDKGIVDNGAYAWETIPGPCGDASFDAQHKSLSDWKSSYGTEDIVAIEIEVDGWISESGAHISSVMLNGKEISLATYVTTETQIHLSCNDPEPHPVDRSTVHWRYSWWPDGFDGQAEYSGWSEEPGETTVSFSEDSWHDLEFYCTDALGNEGETDTEYFMVDTQPPKVSKEMLGPWEGDCPPEKEGDVCYIDGTTEIKVDVTDPIPHPVDDVTCEWGYNWNKEFHGWFEAAEIPFTVHFEEESEHILHVLCRDALGNEVRDIETFYVDKTPPGIWKEYRGPYFSDQFDTYWAEWISSDTSVVASVTDAGPHKSGIAEVKYRTEVVADEDCRYPLQQEVIQTDYACETAEGTVDWTIVDPADYDEFVFNIPKESCHLIEIMATDEVDKCNLHKQRVFVDNKPPTPVKKVSDPKTVWDGADSNFYNEELEDKSIWIKDYCRGDPLIENSCPAGENCIDCWKVTLDTPISMTCEDPDPHPVDHERICFNVELDGVDATDIYCDESQYDGDMENGYCCLDHTIQDFTFLEPSEHNLKFYCEDALGNVGPIDDEKFKVDGNEFEIELNKKWNLVSVPVVLLNDDPAEVFEGLECVDTIWAYDGEEWTVFSPDDAPDNLRIEPGYGYWIMAKEDCTLTIGGSLLAAGRTPPSRDLVPGWNLIGYYGMEGSGCPDGICTEYNGPAGNGDEAYCSLYSLVNTNAMIPTKRWSSVYGYWETASPQFDGYGMCDKMDPGAGYWIHMPTDLEEYYYAPSTGCPTAFWDLICGVV
jgi:hypothetical protein